MAAQLTFTNGLLDQSLHLWMASAISSLPVPVSPLDQHRGAGWRYHAHQAKYSLESGAVADNPG
jgi:hypothetical protein